MQYFGLYRDDNFCMHFDVVNKQQILDWRILLWYQHDQYSATFRFVLVQCFGHYRDDIVHTCHVCVFKRSECNRSMYKENDQKIININGNRTVYELYNFWYIWEQTGKVIICIKWEVFKYLELLTEYTAK